MRSLEQQRAAYAWQKVQDQSRDYRNLVKSAPALVMSNGLMQTLAFLKGKGKDHHEDLLRHLAEWLEKRNLVKKHVKKDDFENVMESLYQKDSADYQRATEEVLAILRWLRHLADTVESTQKPGEENE